MRFFERLVGLFAILFAVAACSTANTVQQSSSSQQEQVEKYLVDNSPFVVEDDKKVYEAEFFFGAEGELYVRTSNGDRFAVEIKFPEHEITYGRPGEFGQLVLTADGTLRNIPPIPSHPSGPELRPKKTPPAV